MKIAAVLVALFGALWLSDSTGLFPGPAMTGYQTLEDSASTSTPIRLADTSQALTDTPQTPQKMSGVPSGVILLYEGTNYVAVTPDMMGKTGSQIAKSSTCDRGFDKIGTLEGSSYMNAEIPQSMLGRAMRFDVKLKNRIRIKVFGRVNAAYNDYSDTCSFPVSTEQYQQPPLFITSAAYIGVTSALTGRPIKEILASYGCDLESVTLYYRTGKERGPISLARPKDSNFDKGFIGSVIRVELKDQCTLYGETARQAQPGQATQPTSTSQPEQTGTAQQKCAKSESCPSSSAWKCASSNVCYSSSVACAAKCHSQTPTLASQPVLECSCSDWETSGGCGQQGCAQDRIPQTKSCTGGASCKTENKCVESAQCIESQDATRESSTGIDLSGNLDIGVYDDIAERKFSELLTGECLSKVSVQTYDSDAGNWPYVYTRSTAAVTDTVLVAGMKGLGLSVSSTASPGQCKLITKGYNEKFGVDAAKLLGSGKANFRVVPKSMTATSKSFQDIKGTCVITGLYGAGIVVGKELPLDFKFTPEYLGKAVQVFVSADCELDDAQAAGQAVESTKETGTTVTGTAQPKCAKSETCPSSSAWKCVSNSNCYSSLVSCSRQCPSITDSSKTEEKKEEQKPARTTPSQETEPSQDDQTDQPPTEGVNLVPELVVTPSTGIKGGDTIEVVLNVKNTGTRSTHDPAIYGRCASNTDNVCRLSFYNVVYFYKDREYGTEVAPFAGADVSLLFPDKEIKPGGQGQLEAIKRSVRIPDDFSGNLVIVAVVNSQRAYIEAEGGLADNRQTKTIAVRAAKLPYLIVTEAEPMPTLEKVPVTLAAIRIKVKNTGELDAVAENQFLENKVTIKKGSTAICSGSIRNLLTVKPGAFAAGLPNIEVKAPGNNPCLIDDKNANYWAVVEADATEIFGKKGFVAESNEDNTLTFQLKGPQICAPPGAMEAGKYCSIATGTWLTQKDSGQQCSHNFECALELCIKDKCVTEAQKEQILKIVG